MAGSQLLSRLVECICTPNTALFQGGCRVHVWQEVHISAAVASSSRYAKLHKQTSDTGRAERISLPEADLEGLSSDLC